MKNLLPILLIAFSASASELVPAASSSESSGLVPLKVAQDGEYEYTNCSDISRTVRVALPLVTISYAGRKEEREFNGVEKAYVPKGDEAVILFFKKRLARMIYFATGDKDSGQEIVLENAEYDDFKVDASARTVRQTTRGK